MRDGQGNNLPSEMTATMTRRRLSAGIVGLALPASARAQHSPNPPTRPTPDNQGLGKTGSIGEEGTGNLPHAGQADPSKSLGRGGTPPENQDPGHQHSNPAQPMGESNPRQKQ